MFNQNSSDFDFNINNSIQTFNQSGSGTTNDFGHKTFFQSVSRPWIPFILGGVLLTPVAIFGVLGNILSISVLTQKQMRSSLSVLLIGLSFCDAFVCLASILVIGLPALFKHFDIASAFSDVMCVAKRFIFPIALTAQTGSAYFTVAVTFERYIAVCRPLQSRSICTWDRARFVTLAILVFSILSNIPRYISYASREEILLANHTCQSNPNSSKSTDTISSIVYTVFMCLIPICTVVVVNCIIIRTIRQQNTTRDQLSRHQLKEIKLTNMLITVVAIYVFCNIFRLFNAFTKITFDSTYSEVVSFTNFLVTFNSAVNYLIYCAFGKTFRQSFVLLFCECKRRANTRSLSSRRDRFQSTIRMPVSISESTFAESVVAKSIRRLSKDVMNFVGGSRSQEYNVNNEN